MEVRVWSVDNTVLQKKKIPCVRNATYNILVNMDPWRNPTFAGCRDQNGLPRYRGLKFPLFAIWSFFHVWCFGWKILQFTPSEDAIERNIWNFFLEFFVHILRQQRGLKWKKRHFNTSEGSKQRISTCNSSDDRFYWAEQLKFCSLFFAHTVLQKRGWKWEKPDSVHLKMCPNRRLSHP